MTLARPELLLAAPVLLAVLAFGLRRRGGVGLRGGRIARLWADRRGVRPLSARRRLRGRGILSALGVVCVVAAIARPQWGMREEVEVEPSREVLLALDLSRSMLAEDVPPSRLARARLLIEGLLGELRGERVGLVLFAGTAFLQSPLSADYEVMRDLLPELDVGYLPQGGTDYAAMLDAALEGFGREAAADRFLIVLSDGESHDPHWREQLPRLRELGVRVLALGIGSETGALVPDGAGGVVKDERGAAVLSRLEPATLRELAEASDGVYREAASWVDLAALVEQTVARGRRGDFVETRSERRIERFQWLLAPGVLLLLLGIWLELPAAPLARRPGRAAPAADRARTRLAVGLAVLSVLVPVAAPWAEEGAASDVLLQTLADLASRPVLGAGDYARLAESTLEHAAARAATAGAGGLSEGVVEDGLLAVTVGERLDPEAADWPELRRRLEALAKTEPPPPGEANAETQPPAESEQGTGAGPGGASSEAEAPQVPPSNQGEGAGDSAAGNGSDAQRPGDGEPDSAPDAGEEAERAADADERSSAEPRQEAPSVPRGEALGADAKPPDPARESSSGDEAATEPATRLVGGGDDALRELLAAHPELAAVLGRMQKVRSEDSPSRLFQRLDETEGRRREPTGRDW